MESTSTSASATARRATSQLITALGGGSGIDMAAMAENLAMAQYATRVDRLAAKSELLERQILAASDLRSMIFSLATSLGDRVRHGDLSPQPQIANSAVAQLSLSGGSQPKGSYSLEVTALAASQTLAGPGYAAASDPVGAGTLTLRFGTVSGTDFTEDAAHAAVDITIESGATLTDVARAINAKNAGVTAYVSNTVDGAKLVLKGQEGAANGFILEAAENAGEPGLANLAWSPSSGSGTLLASAADAAFKIDGLPITASSNTVADAIPGVSLQLTATNVGAPTNVTFANPSVAITTAMQDLTAALNEVASVLKSATDPKFGDLARDPGARALQRAFSSLAGSIIMPNAAEGSPATLADLGLSTQRDGTFILDTTRLAATLARDAEGAAAMFTTGLHGVYAKIDNISRSAGAISDPSTLAGSISRYTSQMSKISEDQAEIAEQQEALRARLAARFAVSEARVSASKSTLSFIQNQIAAWNKDNG